MKRISTILILLMLVCMGTRAAEYTITFSNSTGSYTATNSDGTWASAWKSTATDPYVTLTVGANNIHVSSGNIYSGSNGATYTITAQTGYLIKGYTIVGTAQTAAQTLTPAEGGTAVEFGTDKEYTLSATGLSLPSTSFTQSTPNNGIAILSFTIDLDVDPEFVFWTPSLGDKYISVGEKVASFSTVTEGSDNSKWYILTQDRGGETPMYNAGTGNQLMRAAAGVTTGSINGQKAADYASHLIRFVSASGDTYNIQFADGNWITSRLTTALSKSDAGTYAFYNCNGGSGSYFGWNLNSTTGSIVDNNGAGSTLSFWDSNVVSGTSGNNVWHLYPVTLPDAAYSITYILPNTSQNNMVVSHISGDAPSAPTAWVRDGVTFSYYSSYDNGEFSNPVSTITGDATVYVKYEYSLSNILSASTSESDLRWYRLAASSNNAYYDLYYNGTAPYPYKAQSAFDGSDGYFWAFVGNPIDGVKVYNKALGNTQTMVYNDATNPVMGTDNGTKWYITISNGMIGFKYTSDTGKRWNDFGGGAATLKYYGSESWHQYTYIDEVDYTTLYTNNIKPFIDDAGTGYFKISNQNATTLEGEYNSANNDSKITLSEYASLANSLNNKISWPTTGYYRVKSVSADKYLTAESASQLTVGTGTGASTIVYLNGSNGTYTMQMQGQNVYAQSNGYASILSSFDRNIYLTIPVVEGKLSPGKVTIGNGQTATDYHCVNGTNVQSIAIQTNTNDNQAAYWTVEPATSFTGTLTNAKDNTNTEHSYATLCVPFAITNLSGAVAYAPTINGSYLNMDNGASTVGAGTPVILVGAKDAGSYTAAINTESAPVTSPVTTNALRGTFTGTTLDCTAATGENYVLGFDADNDNRIGFYHVANGGSFSLSANRAYLSNGSSARGYAINWSDASSVQDMKAAEDVNSAVVYDLQGRRVENPQHGMYIRNGRVIVVK